jgi:hypothetical protein
MGFDRGTREKRMVDLFPSGLADANAAPFLPTPNGRVMDREEMQRQQLAPAEPFGEREILPEQGQEFGETVAFAKVCHFVEDFASQARGALTEPAQQEMRAPREARFVAGAGEMENVTQFGIIAPRPQEPRGSDSGMKRDPHAQGAEKNGFRAQNLIKREQSCASGKRVLRQAMANATEALVRNPLVRTVLNADPLGKRLDIQWPSGWIA